MTRDHSYFIHFCQMSHRWGRPLNPTGQFTPSSPTGQSPVRGIRSDVSLSSLSRSLRRRYRSESCQRDQIRRQPLLPEQVPPPQVQVRVLSRDQIRHQPLLPEQVPPPQVQVRVLSEGSDQTSASPPWAGPAAAGTGQSPVRGIRSDVSLSSLSRSRRRRYRSESCQRDQIRR